MTDTQDYTDNDLEDDVLGALHDAITQCEGEIHWRTIREQFHKHGLRIVTLDTSPPAGPGVEPAVSEREKATADTLRRLVEFVKQRYPEVYLVEQYAALAAYTDTQAKENADG